VMGPHGSPSCQMASRVPQATRKYAKGIGRSRAFVAEVGRGRSRSRQGAGVGHFDDVMGARARQKLPLETSPQGSGGMKIDFHASSD
jgi:hypothetical protein